MKKRKSMLGGVGCVRWISNGWCIPAFMAWFILIAGGQSHGFGYEEMVNELSKPHPEEGAVTTRYKDCSEGKGLGFVVLVLSNRASYPVHLVIDGAPPDPSNLYSPGQTRSIKLSASPSARITVQAVRGTGIVASQIWTRDPGSPCSVPVLLFGDGGSNTFSVVLGMRP